MTDNFWNNAFVEQLESDEWVVSCPNEFRNNEIFVELDGFSTEDEATAALDEARLEFGRDRGAERHYAMLCEYARI